MAKTLDDMDKSMYSIIKVDDIENYKCVLCDFTTVYKNSLLRHLSKKNLCYKSKEYKCETCNKIFDQKQNLNNHLNKKNKCNISIFNESSNENESINDIILLERDILKKDILYLKEENDRLKRLLEEKDMDNMTKYKDFYDTMSEDIVEIMDSKKCPLSLRKGVYINKIEYIILHGSLTRHRYDEISDESRDSIKRRLFCLMDIISDSFFDKFMEEVKSNYKYLLPFIREYQYYLKTLDSKKKVNDKYPVVYNDIINVKLGNLLESL